MWLSKREGHGKKEPAEAQTGPVTLAGGELGAWLEGERRGVAVFSPGGYHWAPRVGEEILVLKAGENGEQPCAVGVAESGSLSPGEVLIQSGAATVRLSPDGGLQLSTRKGAVSMTPDGETAVTGIFTVNGTVVGPLPPPEEGEDD